MHLTLGAEMPQVRSGSTGEEVRIAQQLLKNKGYQVGPIDGIFGPQTETMVKAFQTAYGLQVDGIIGPETWKALQAIGPGTAPAPPTPPPAMIAPLPKPVPVRPTFTVQMGLWIIGGLAAMALLFGRRRRA